jgi:chromosome segregation ATPase
MEALKMETPMTEWNDNRLDELNERVKDSFAEVDKRFDKVDERFVRVESEIKEGFARVDEHFDRMEQRFATKEDMNRGFGEVKAEIRGLNERFDRLLHTLVLSAWGFVGTVVATLIGLAAF